jgi:uncharacterized protein YkwD
MLEKNRTSADINRDDTGRETGATGMQIIEHRRTTLKLGVILAALLMLGLVAPRRADATTSAERSMIAMINHARDTHGRAALRVSDSLSNYARKHSATMASKNVLYHNPYLATWLKNWSWRILGENVGVGPSVRDLHIAFMHSPAHRENILDRRFLSIGVGIVERDGRIWVTVIFRG